MEAVATSLMIFGVHNINFFIIKVYIRVLIKWSYTSPQLCSLLSLEWLSYFEHAI